MELKLTTVGAIAYEEKTGRDILETLGDIASAAEAGRTPKLKQLVDIFCSMGAGYTVEMFDEWEIPFKDKVVAITEAARDYIVGKGKNGKAVSASSSKGATTSVRSQKK